MTQFPSETELRKWWQQDVEFSRTELGRLFIHLRDRCQRMESERDHYRKIVMDLAALQPDVKTILHTVKPRQELE